MKFPDIFWVPPWCRLDDTKPLPFNIWLNILFGCAGGFTAANLYYSHPILDVMAESFHTDQSGVSNIPSLALAGDVTGLLFILPLADFLPRRKFVLALTTLSTIFWIGLCITKNLQVFLVLTYLSAVFNGATQIMLPLVSELAPAESRALHLSIVAAGPTFGILIARILSGIVANYTAWRNIYWLALALNATVVTSLWLLMPNYPASNPTKPRDIAKTYPKIIWSIVTMYPKYPVLVQAGLISFCTMFTVASYWTTLTFLLSGSPYNYSTIVIGLFGLVGAATMILGPIYGKYVVQPLKQPLYSVAVGKTISLVGIVVGTFVGVHNVAGPILQALLLDAGLMLVQISNRMSIHPIEPKGRNRVNTAFVSVLYAGMLSGTKAGNVVYEKYGGWTASGSLSLAMILFGYVVIAARGPHEDGWLGWSGGWGYEPKTRNRSVEEGTDTDNVVAVVAETKIASG